MNHAGSIGWLASGMVVPDASTLDWDAAAVSTPLAHHRRPGLPAGAWTGTLLRAISCPRARFRSPKCGRRTATWPGWQHAVRQGRLPAIDSPDREVVVVPARDAAEVVRRTVQLVGDSIPGALDIPTEEIQVVTPRPWGLLAYKPSTERSRGVAEGRAALSGPHAAGSRWPAVVLVLPGEAAGALSRALVYTAVTRAERHLSVVHAAGSGACGRGGAPPRPRRPPHPPQGTPKRNDHGSAPDTACRDRRHDRAGFGGFCVGGVDVDAVDDVGVRNGDERRVQPVLVAARRSPGSTHVVAPAGSRPDSSARASKPSSSYLSKSTATAEDASSTLSTTSAASVISGEQRAPGRQQPLDVNDVVVATRHDADRVDLAALRTFDRGRDEGERRHLVVNLEQQVVVYLSSGVQCGVGVLHGLVLLTAAVLDRLQVRGRSPA